MNVSELLLRIRSYLLLVPALLITIFPFHLGCRGDAGNEPVSLARPAPAIRPTAPQPATAPVARPAQPPSTGAAISSLNVRLRFTQEKREIGIVTTAPGAFKTASGELPLAAGHWCLTVTGVVPARQRVHVFPKTFGPGEQAALEACLAEWRQAGYQPTVEVFGKELRSSRGSVVDNRLFWVSLAKLPTQTEADAFIATLKTQQVWAWTRPETIVAGKGILTVSDGAGNVVATVPLPAQLLSAQPIHLMNVDSGFWRETRNDRTHAAPLSLEVGATGALEILGDIPLEIYLQGVVPAEMPPSWPAEALAAQAVAARSEVLASLAGKHRMEGFDFCALEHCRAYKGLGGHTPGTDAAVASTSGEVLLAGSRAVPTVFSANCGGWTEDNESVWSGPVNPALRAVPDFPAGRAPAGIGAISAWVGARPAAYCASDAASFRWIRSVSAAELTASVNRKIKVGNVLKIQPGARGSGGRLKSCTVVGSQGTGTVEKELNIRLAFGGLPSAVFTVENSGDEFVFRGAGRGHGVGLCQQGARGMAAQGVLHGDILRHYFSGAEVERL